MFLHGVSEDSDQTWVDAQADLSLSLGAKIILLVLP